MGIAITVTPTRNPDSVTFTVDRDLLPSGESLSFTDAASAEFHSLARALFDIRGVLSVWIIGREIMVTKEEKARWGSIQPFIIEAIKKNLDT